MECWPLAFSAPLPIWWSMLWCSGLFMIKKKNNNNFQASQHVFVSPLIFVVSTTSISFPPILIIISNKMIDVMMWVLPDSSPPFYMVIVVVFNAAPKLFYQMLLYLPWIWGKPNSPLALLLLHPFSPEFRILGCQEQILCRPPELGFEGHLSCLVVEWAGLCR